MINPNLEDDFKRGGFISEIIRRLAALEKFQRDLLSGIVGTQKTGVDVAPSHGLLATIGAGATQYLTPYGTGLNAGLNASWVLGGTFRILRLRINSAQPGGGSLVITLQVNAIDTALVLTIPAGSPAGSYVNNVNSAAVLAGNLVRFKCVNNDGANPSAQIDGLGVRCEYPL